MKEKIASLQEKFQQELHSCTSVKELEALKIRILGKKGLLQECLKDLKNVPADQKPQAGKIVNDCKVFLEKSIDNTLQKLLSQEEEKKLQTEHIDITLPARSKWAGSKHPITHVMDEMIDIFVSMGFAVQYAPELDSEYYNFDVLNMPEDHSARQMQDTFYAAPGTVLRTHCTNLQGHIMERNNPPLRLICPGRCYRNESISSRSHAFFHQIDGFYVDEHVSFQDLYATLSEFCRRFFKKDVDVRMRPSYFPFVEPGVELDITCLLCDAKGCNICKHSGWLEVLGAGMIHPQVFRNVGLDPEKYTGYAWGMGVERTVLLRHGISDIRLFSENDMRFLRQFVSV